MRASDKIVKIRRKIFQSKSVIGFGCSDLPDSNSILRTTCGHREQIGFQAPRSLLNHSAVAGMETSQEPQQIL